MIKKIHGLVCLLLVIFSAVASISQCKDFSIHGDQQKNENIFQITLLHTNDHHGRFWKNSRGEYGMAARKTLIDRIRSEVESQGNSENIKNIEFTSAIDYCRDMVPQLKARSDILIALTHLGYYPNAAHGSKAPGNPEFSTGA